METRIAKVSQMFDSPTRTGGTRFEAFFRAVDGNAPASFAATTFEPFTAALMEDARRANRDLWVTIDKDAIGGLELIRVEHATDEH